jgi:hypothetical protein
MPGITPKSIKEEEEEEKKKIMHRLDKLFCIQRSEIPPSLWTSYMNSSYKCPTRRRKTPPCRSSAGMEQTNNTNPRHGKDP